MEILGVLALILVVGLMIVKPVLNNYFPEASVRFRKYYPYAVMAFKFVERNIPDDIGTDKDDPIAEKYARKVDLFCQKFIEYTKKFSNEEPSEAMLEEAKNLATYLARNDVK